MTDGAERLRTFLDDNKITLDAAAKALGVKGGPVLHGWLNGSRKPRPEYRKAIAIWTRGAVTAESWEDEKERAAMSAVKPFSKPAA